MQTPTSQRGFSLIELLIVVAVIGVVSAIAIPNLLASRRAANEASAISAVRTLTSVEESFRSTYGGGSAFATFAELRSYELIDGSLAGATTAATAKSGYIYAITLTGGATVFCVGAAPATANTGSRNFSSNVPGVLFQHPFNVAAPPTSVAGGTPLN
jgi:type IV pilus assembly protein PilA